MLNLMFKKTKKKLKNKQRNKQKTNKTYLHKPKAVSKISIFQFSHNLLASSAICNKYGSCLLASSAIYNKYGSCLLASSAIYNKYGSCLCCLYKSRAYNLGLRKKMGGCRNLFLSTRLGPHILHVTLDVKCK